MDQEAEREVGDVDLPNLQKALIARGNVAQQRLLTKIGRLLSTREFGERLGGISRQSVNEKKNAGQAIAVTFQGRKGDFYPEFQLDGGAIRPWVPIATKLLPLRSWALLTFLTRDLEDLGGLSPLEDLLQNGAVAEDRFASIARSYVEV